MKKQLFLTTAMAATLSGCGSNDWDENVYARNDTRLCVDQNGYRVDDDLCGSGYRGGGARSVGWFYVNRGSRVPYYGDSVRDQRLGIKGSYDARPGASYASAPSDANMTRSAAKSRGGFGSSSRSFGGGRS